MVFRTTSMTLFLCLLFATSQVFAGNNSKSITSWDGQYIGFSIGASKGEADPTVHAEQTTYFNGTDPAQLDPEGSYDMDVTKLSGNLFWGLNYQTDNLVYGFEVSVSLSDYDESHNSGSISYLTLPTDSFSLSTHVKSNWAVCIRPRFGYAFQKSLLYLTVGPSLRQFEYNFTFSDMPTSNQSTNQNKTKWKLGWVGGFGYEFQIQDAWSLRTEYLYSIYKDVIDTQSSLTGHPTDGFKHELDFTEHSLFIGLSRRF